MPEAPTLLKLKCPGCSKVELGSEDFSWEITAESLQARFEELGDPITATQAKQMIAINDADGDARFNFTEFL